MFLQKIKDHISRFLIKMRIHCNFPEQVFKVMIINYYCTKSIPKVIEGKKTFPAH